MHYRMPKEMSDRLDSWTRLARGDDDLLYNALRNCVRPGEDASREDDVYAYIMGHSHDTDEQKAMLLRIAKDNPQAIARAAGRLKEETGTQPLSLLVIRSLIETRAKEPGLKERFMGLFKTEKPTPEPISGDIRALANMPGLLAQAMTADCLAHPVPFYRDLQGVNIGMLENALQSHSRLKPVLRHHRRTHPARRS